MLLKDGNKYLIHNKHFTGSSSLSHLFSQGNVASQLLTNPDFRKKVNEKIKTGDLKYHEDEKFDARKHKIVYGIIKKINKNGKFTLPLFSLINLKIFIDSIKSRSFDIKIWFYEESL